MWSLPHIFNITKTAFNLGKLTSGGSEDESSKEGCFGGLVPLPGWTGEHEWEGWIPYEELPALFNPEWGYIVTANHAIVDEDYPYYIDTYWADGDRGQRITEMIEAKIEAGKITSEDFANIQFDTKSLRAESFLPLLGNLSSDEATVQAAIERRRGWDKQVERASRLV